ncbi:replication-relaxation family protein [Kribbella sp. NPDC056345]|uniref:replication-relaxation family protein n=1 Tax=Kribbella sp. NPDC056345 TaxID=3345789 RepID=UPI0035D56F11
MTNPQEGDNRRIASRIALSKNQPSRWSEGQDSPLRTGNSSPISDAQLPDSSAPSPRTSRRTLRRIQRDANSRDLEILRSVGEYRFLTTSHLEALHFTDHASKLAATRSANRVLKRLSEQGLVTPLDRRVGGVRAGSAGYTWRLTASGNRLLHAADPDARTHRFREPSERLLKHTIAVADTHIRLLKATTTGVELVRVQVEPWSWRPFLGLSGERRLLRPDLAAVTAQGEYEDHWFLEVDLGTEHPPTIVRKCQLYEDYRRSGVEQETHGLFPRVLWIMSSQVRVEKITAALESSHIDMSLFRVITADQLVDTVIGGAA